MSLIKICIFDEGPLQGLINGNMMLVHLDQSMHMGASMELLFTIDPRLTSEASILSLTPAPHQIHLIFIWFSIKSFCQSQCCDPNCNFYDLSPYKLAQCLSILLWLWTASFLLCIWIVMYMLTKTWPILGSTLSKERSEGTRLWEAHPNVYQSKILKSGLKTLYFWAKIPYPL